MTCWVVEGWPQSAAGLRVPSEPYLADSGRALHTRRGRLGVSALSTSSIRSYWFRSGVGRESRVWRWCKFSTSDKRTKREDLIPWSMWQSILIFRVRCGPAFRSDRLPGRIEARKVDWKYGWWHCVRLCVGYNTLGPWYILKFLLIYFGNIEMVSNIYVSYARQFKSEAYA